MTAAPAATPGALTRRLKAALRDSRWTKVLSSTITLELIAVAAVAIAAVLVRWPELMTVPRFTDEIYEVAFGRHIARGGTLPLTFVNPHIGPVFHYLLAGAIWLLGPTIGTGRLVVMLLGALSIVPTYLLGRSIGGPTVGLLAALLLAASATHVVVNSHIAYSHSIMPLFSTTGLWLLHRAVAGRSGPHLAASGLAFGLALQTHPTALAIWPGLALYVVWQGQRLVGRWLLLAGAGALLSISNLLVHNVRTGMSGLVAAVEKSEAYRSGTPLSLDGWADRLLLLLREASTGLGGLVGESVQRYAVLHPLVAVYAVLAVLGLIVLCRRGEWLVSLAVLSGLLVISLLNGRLEPVVVRARHYALLLPLGYVAVAVSLVFLHQLAARAAPRKWIADGGGLAVVLALLSAPVLFLHEYYEWAYREQRTNRPVLAAVEAIARSKRLNETVYLDRKLRDEMTLSGGTLWRSISRIFEMRGQRFAEIDLETGKLPTLRKRSNALLMVLDAETVELAASRYRLHPLSGSADPNSPLRVFRAEARGRS